MRFFALDFFTNGSFQSPLLGNWRLFKFDFDLEETIAIFDWLSAIVYNDEESILPVLFNTESYDSLHRSQRGVTNVWILWRSSGLPFNTGSRYSPYCFMRRVTTPRIVDSKETLTTSGSLFLTILKDSPSLPLKERWSKKNQLCM